MFTTLMNYEARSCFNSDYYVKEKQVKTTSNDGGQPKTLSI